MTIITRAEFTPVLLELLTTTAAHLNFDPAEVISIDENMPDFTLHFSSGRILHLSVAPMEDTGVPLKTVIAAFMEQIGKSIDDVKSVNVQLPYIYIILFDGESITIETTNPDGDFITQH